MARMDSLFDNVQGSMGNLVFYQMNGRNYVRTRPEKYSDAKSPGQLAQRMRMQVVNQFLKPFSRLIKTTFAPEAGSGSARHAALSYNMRHALMGDYPDIRIDPARVLLSRGTLPLPASTSLSAQGQGLLIGWENRTEGASNDTLVVMACWPADGWCEYRFSEAMRSKGEYFWQTSRPVTPGALPQVWIAFRNEPMGQMSDSLFLG